METKAKMSVKQATVIATMAWSGLMGLADSSAHGMTHKLREALKAEKREGLPQNLAKLRLVESAISGAERPTRNLGDLYGIRDAHVQVMMLGARLASDHVRLEAIMGLQKDLNEAGKVLESQWEN